MRANCIPLVHSSFTCPSRIPPPRSFPSFITQIHHALFLCFVSSFWSPPWPFTPPSFPVSLLPSLPAPFLLFFSRCCPLPTPTFLPVVGRSLSFFPCCRCHDMDVGSSVEAWGGCWQLGAEENPIYFFHETHFSCSVPLAC